MSEWGSSLWPDAASAMCKYFASCAVHVISRRQAGKQARSEEAYLGGLCAYLALWQHPLMGFTITLSFWPFALTSSDPTQSLPIPPSFQPVLGRAVLWFSKNRRFSFVCLFVCFFSGLEWNLRWLFHCPLTIAIFLGVWIGMLIFFVHMSTSVSTKELNVRKWVFA